MKMRGVHAYVSPPNGLALVLHKLNNTVTDLTARTTQQYDIMLHTLRSVDKQGAALYKNVAATKQSLRGDIETAERELERQNLRATDAHSMIASLASRCDSLAARCESLAAHNRVVAYAIISTFVYASVIAIGLVVYFRWFFV